ncbi:MAG: LLM class flavin-dependent oxidoreductase [Chloroflexi bacterium]|nr:LLM class flavin-dependent oxidoreductase [Chloroflexota bacterium]MBV9896628.1 LLM class flavin-dependent oxidoreductase [Chloroflexota bacterium]
MSDLGVMIRRDTAEPTLRSVARLAEELGYRCVWVNHPPNQDGFGPLSWAAQATQRVALGIGVVPVAAHNPAYIMQRISETGLTEARLRLGIGSGSSQQPLTAVRQALSELRSRTTCELVVAALGPRMCELAGREADGVLLNAVTPAYARESADRIAEAARRAGRAASPRVYVLVSVGLGEAAAAVQQRAGAFYGQLPAYREHFKRMGVEPDQVLLAARTESELREQLAQWSGVVDEAVVGVVLTRDDPGEAEAILRAAQKVIH